MDIVGQGLDLALRVATLSDSELVARRIARNPRIICAAPDYLRKYGRPATVADLARHQCVILQVVLRWPLLINGHLERHPVRGRVVTSSVEAARTAALQGLGLSMLTYWDVHEQLADGSLVGISLSDAAMEDLAVWAVMPTRCHVPARVTVFLAALEDALSRLSCDGT